MKAAFSIPLLMLAACGSADLTERNRIMDQVELQVRMPKGAGKIEQYNRFYAAGPNSHIIGIYTTLPGLGLPVGQRRWEKNSDALPVINDGGCSVVTIDFDTQSKKIVHTDCNGDA